MSADIQRAIDADKLEDYDDGYELPWGETA